jgi:hypothetical protein
VAIADLNKPTDEEVREYWRAYGQVIEARRAGFHKPYNNLHDSEGLWLAYDLGFRDALDKLGEPVPA